MCFTTKRYDHLKCYCNKLACSWRDDQRDAAHSKDIKSFLQGLSGDQLKPIRTKKQLDDLVATLEYIASQHKGFADNLLSYIVSILSIIFGIIIAAGFASSDESLVYQALMIAGWLFALAVLVLIVSAASTFIHRPERELLSAIRIAQLEGDLTIDEVSDTPVYTQVTSPKADRPPALTISIVFREKVNRYYDEHAARYN